MLPAEVCDLNQVVFFANIRLIFVGNFLFHQVSDDCLSPGLDKWNHLTVGLIFYLAAHYLICVGLLAYYWLTK